MKGGERGLRIRESVAMVAGRRPAAIFDPRRAEPSISGCMIERDRECRGR
jgi:hypothetical protein